MLTVSARPPRSLPLTMLIAFCASAWVSISTKAKPLERPVSRSRTTVTVLTVPAVANMACSSSSVAVYGRLPTYNFVSMSESLSTLHGVRRLWRREVNLTIAQQGCLEREAEAQGASGPPAGMGLRKAWRGWAGAEGGSPEGDQSVGGG